MKKLFLFCFFIFSLFSFSQSNDEVKEEEIEIAVGIDRTITTDFQFNGNIILANESLISAKASPLKKRIILRGLKQGKTSLSLYDNAGDLIKRYIITVSENEKTKIVANLRELIGDVEGVSIGIKGDQVVVEGNIVRPDDIGRVAIVLDGYEKVLNLVDISPIAKRQIAEYMTRELAKNGYRDVRVRVVNKTFWLEGSVDSAASKSLAYEIAKAYLPDDLPALYKTIDQVVQVEGRSAILNFISINPQKKAPEPIPKLIKVTAQFVELSKEYAKVFGFKWNPTLGENSGSIRFGRTTGTDGGGLTTESSGTLSGIITNLFPKLESAKGAGYARVIESGFGIAENNTKINITKNSSTPFSLGTNEFTTAQNSSAGFSMNVTPELLREENIRLKGINIQIEVFDGSTAEGKPSTTKNTVSLDSILVKNKESAAIGGVVINTSSRVFDKNPSGGITALEEGSTLFNFERSKNYATSKKQFVIFATPEVLESASAGSEEIRKKFRKRGR